jgi:hypothetical protein
MEPELYEDYATRNDWGNGRDTACGGAEFPALRGMVSKDAAVRADQF